MPGPRRYPAGATPYRYAIQPGNGRRASGSAGRSLLAGCAVVTMVLLVAVVGLGVIINLMALGSASTTAPSTAVTRAPRPVPSTDSPSARPASPAPTTRPPTTRPPSTRPPSTRPPSTRPTPAPTKVPPVPQQSWPPLPAPHSEDPTWRIVQQNRLYGYSMPRGTCPARPVNGFRTQAEFRSYVTNYVNCQHTAWQPIFKGMGKPLPRPRLVWFSPESVLNTQCGTVRNMEVSFYCGNNATYVIYVNSNLISESNDWWTLRAAETLTHEYFHHVQQMSGILPAAYSLYQVMDNNEISRRIELQTFCVSSRIILLTSANAFTRDDYSTLVEWSEKGQDVKHGNARSTQIWMQRGLYQAKVQGCTTWLVGSDDVA